MALPRPHILVLVLSSPTPVLLATDTYATVSRYAISVTPCRSLLPHGLCILPISRRLECLIQWKASISRYGKLVQRCIQKRLFRAK